MDFDAKVGLNAEAKAEADVDLEKKDKKKKKKKKKGFFAKVGDLLDGSSSSSLELPRK